VEERVVAGRIAWTNSRRILLILKAHVVHQHHRRWMACTVEWTKVLDGSDAREDLFLPCICRADGVGREWAI
jgi:hypothetical protein